MKTELTQENQVNDLDDMTIGDARALARMFTGTQQQDPSPYEPGSAWVWRSVTHYTVGVVDRVVGTSIVLVVGTGCWVADTGRYSEFLRDGWSAAREVEPYPGDCVAVVERGAVVDAHSWPHGPGHKVVG